MEASENRRFAGEVRWLRRIAIAVLILLAVSTGLNVHSFARTLCWRMRTSRRSSPSRIAASWEMARHAMDRGNFQIALEMARELSRQNPDYYYGHSFLGVLYLARGQVQKAQEAYRKAYELFPTEENAKAFRAVQKRVKVEQYTDQQNDTSD